MHLVAVLALDGAVAFDLTIPCEVFGRASAPGLARPYEVRVCGPSAAVRTGHFDLGVPFGIAAIAEADTVVVPGVEDVGAPVPSAVLHALREASLRGARVASICTGAFVLAAAGLLDGRRCTTHWKAAGALAARYPAARVDPDVLFVDDGEVLTSAGAAAGLDLCFYMLRRDLGAAVAAEAARAAVMPPEREGGQSQFILRPPPAAGDGLAPLLAWLARNLDRPISLAAMADEAGTSPRSLTRRFRRETGTTPLQWLLTARIRHAQALLERTALPVERVATDSGFDTASTFRDRFMRVVGVSPTAYRRAFGGAGRNGADARGLRAAPGHTRHGPWPNDFGQVR